MEGENLSIEIYIVMMVNGKMDHRMEMVFRLINNIKLNIKVILLQVLKLDKGSILGKMIIINMLEILRMD